MDVWIPNNKDRLRKTLLGSVPTPSVLENVLKRPIPKVIHKVLDETNEDLEEIKKVFNSLGVEVLSYPVPESKKLENHINVRNGFIVVDDQLFITEKLEYLNEFYNSVGNKIFVPHEGSYCPDIYIHDDYAILDGLGRKEYTYWRSLLEGKRKIFSGHPDTPSKGYDIKIGNGTWIASGAILIGGVEVGSNCIVCSGAVVTKSFPDNSVIAGIPAKKISSTLNRG